ncbi:MAG: AAA family ATPase [Akkermansiaceae bacterium]|nr:AAA family ATPase [Verrucomicrobiales bacterium]
METNRLAEISKSENAEASSAHSRINIPLNLENWRALDQETQNELLWFHQHALDQKLTLKDCGAALGYDGSTVFRVLKGTYEGSWKNVVEAIRSYRKLVLNRATIQKNEFSENGLTRLIYAGLDYALANNSITLITGESRQGKSITVRNWQQANNHGRSVLITAPAFGGTKGLLRDICETCGQGKNKSTPDAHAAILRAFNGNRILIVDEAHRLLPGDRRSNPVNLEILRDIHDRTGCALALIATARFDAELRKGEYMFEQLIGRIGMPIRLPRKIKKTDISPIVSQYVSRPSDALLDICNDIANKPGRLGIMVETLKVASRIAKKKSAKLDESHIFSAIKLREQMQGETVYAEAPKGEA